MKNISRIIAALLPKKKNRYIAKEMFAQYIWNFFFLFFVIFIGVILQMLVLLNREYIKTKYSYEKKRSDFTYWVGTASQFPNMPDILYNAAVSAYNAGQGRVAISYLDKALQLDPLFGKAQEFKKEIMSVTK